MAAPLLDPTCDGPVTYPGDTKILIKSSNGRNGQTLNMMSVLCRHNTDDINNDTHIDTRYVIVAKHWMWLPDDIFM